MESKTTKSKKEVRNQDTTNLLPEAVLWRSFYALAQHWQSDLKFFEDELNFFRLLIDKNLSILIEPKNIEQTRAMVSHILNLEKERETLHKQISDHVQHITRLVENPFVQDAQRYKEEHAKLENEFGAFLMNFRSIKNEVFRLTERVVHSERARRMIDWA